MKKFQYENLTPEQLRKMEEVYLSLGMYPTGGLTAQSFNRLPDEKRERLFKTLGDVPAMNEEDNEEMNEGPLSLGFDEVEAPSLEEEGEEVVSPLAAVGAAGAVTPQDFLSRLLAREEEAAKRERELFQADIKRIQAAKDRLLGKPKELTGRERLDIILKTLSSRPTDPRDPRFFERKNIGTLLRDIGEAGGSIRETEKTRAEELQKQLDELEAKEAAMLLPRAQAELKDIRGRIPAAMRAIERPGETARTRSLREEAALRGITVEELLKLKDEERRKGKEEPISLSDVAAVSRDVRAVLDSSRGVLANVGTAKQQLKLVKEEGSASAEAQLDRFLAAAVGDRQLSQLEINAVASAGSFPSRVISGLNKFFSGTSGPLKLEEKEAILDALENFHGERFNSSRERIIDAYSGLLPDKRLMSLVGGRYITPSEKKAAQGGGGKRPPQGAIDMLRSNPGLAADFDAKYGAGASKRYLGE